MLRHPPVVRIATPDDSEIITALLAEFNDWIPEPEEMHRRIEQVGGSFAVLLAEKDGKPAGILAMRVSNAFTEPVNRAEVTELYVRPPYRRIGIGRALMEKALLICRERGAQELHLLVNPGNAEAMAFYAVLGFEKHSQHMRREV